MGYLKTLLKKIRCCRIVAVNYSLKVLNFFLDIVFPPKCFKCGFSLTGLENGSICPACLTHIALIKSPFCDVCGKPFYFQYDLPSEDGYWCGDCRTETHYFDKARSLGKYEGVFKEALISYKYKGRRELLKDFIKIYLQSRHDYHFIPVKKVADKIDGIESPGAQPQFGRENQIGRIPKEPPEGVRPGMAEIKWATAPKLQTELCKKNTVKQVYSIDFILYVPLHRKKLQIRGFDQAFLIAKEISKLSNIPLKVDLLFKKKETPPQAALKKQIRIKNLKGAFDVRDSSSLKGKNILLVDDVITTGVTVNECSKVLKQNGANRVDVFTLARAV